MNYDFSDKGRDADTSENVNDPVNSDDGRDLDDGSGGSPSNIEQENPEKPPPAIPKEHLVIDFADEQGETMKERKLKKFEEFKQRRDREDERRRLKA